MRGENVHGARGSDGRLVAGAIACALFVLLAVAVEFLAGLAVNSDAPRWAARIVPIGWPPVLRVAWWLVVAAAAATHRLLLARAGLPRRSWATVATVAPFVLFAASIAGGADWATWH